MEIILLENIMNLGSIGDKVTVKSRLRQKLSLKKLEKHLDLIKKI